jgi:small-conductance mechanosensitive channel
MLIAHAGIVAQTDTTQNITVEVTINDSVYKAKTMKPDTAYADSTRADTLRSQGRKLLSDLNENVPTKPKDVLNAISFSKIFWTIILLLIGYYLIKLSIRILDLVSEKSVRLRITIKSVIPVVRIIIWTIIVFAIVKGIYNPPFETVIAVTASVGIAVGLAAQDLLKNVFGGVALLIDRPFQVGDKIETGSYYGEVIEIGLRATRIVTPDDSTVSVPNAELMNSSVSNSNSGELNCQVVAEIYLPIDVDTELVRKIAIEAAQVSRYVYLNKPIVAVFFNEIKERRSYLKLRLKAYVLDIRYEFNFKSDMTELTIRELLKTGIIKKEELF